MLSISENKSNIDKLDSQSISELSDMKILVEDDKMELSKLKYSTLTQRFNKDYLNLTILPCSACNFDCSYCFEENRLPVFMDDTVEDHIINLIKSYKNTKEIYVTWFGGEPLLLFNRIKTLTKKIIELNKPFNSVLVTNGYLLTNEICDQLEELKIKHIQITIDGLAEIHNQRRKLKNGKGTFDTIVDNIRNLVSKNQNVHLSIRVNVDETNKDEYVKLMRYFHDNISGSEKIFIYPGFVEDINACASVSGCLFDQNKKREFLTDLFKQYQIHLSLFSLIIH